MNDITVSIQYGAPPRRKHRKTEMFQRPKSTSAVPGEYVRLIVTFPSASSERDVQDVNRAWAAPVQLLVASLFFPV
jgi:hypothetical protein